VDDLRRYLTKARDQSVDFIVALRGDPPQGETEFKQAAGGLRHANQLVQLIKAEFDEFGILVAGYPEKHVEAPSMEVDLEHLKRKVDAGADAVITQLFYDNSDFFRFRDQCEALGINVPIVPGILPVTSLHQIQRITSLCGARLPAEFVSQLSREESPQWQFEVGVEQATGQIRGLIDGGVQGIHFYVLNQSDATAKILEALQIRKTDPTCPKR
jgi:methylenetetrahydrofolate reductase (NADPH)